MATILVTGATGTIGSEIVRLLKAAGQPVRALTRKAEKAAELEGQGVEAAVGDLGAPETLAAALDGIERVLLLSSADERQVEQQASLIAAARAAGVAQIVKISALGASADSPIFLAQAHAETERQLKEAGLAWTIIQPHSFMQNLLGSAGSIASQGVFYGAMGQGKVGLVDTRDIAAVAAATLTEEGHAGQTYIVTGPESLTQAQLAEKLSAALGKPVQYVDIPAEQLVESLLGFGVPAFMAKDLGLLNQVFAAGYGDLVTDTVRQVAHKEPISFDQFARDYADAFRG
jgi:uncharacterized protein YbjT (DUF2867 family)